MEERIERLESQLALQDRTIEELNEAMLAQQQQIRLLEKGLAKLSIRVQQLDQAMDMGMNGEEPPPPHYGR